jgi:hypothetical protein
MDIHSVLICGVEEVIHGVTKAKEELTGKATVDFPTSVEVEFGVTSSYEVANYDDVTIAKVKVRVPLFPAGKIEAAPASAAMEAKPSSGNGKGAKTKGK